MTKRRSTNGPDRARLIALAAGGITALNFPLLLVWDRPVDVLGLPMLGVALFAIWGVLIGAMSWVTERAAGPPADSTPQDRG